MRRSEATEPGSDTLQSLTGMQIEELTRVFRDWYDSAPSAFSRKVRGRYWIAFLCMRYTGARIGEVLKINDLTDIDYTREEMVIRLGARKRARRIPLPRQVIFSLAEYLEEFPAMRGRIFTLDQGNFRREFYRRAEEAEIPRKLSHPHILRHTRAMELVRAGVPISLIQSILGHAVAASVLLYVERFTTDPKEILEDRGLL
ncbi:MAG: site-specific integrase [Desulfobacteraceae bacterium]|nr:site-specific integrase [Desulfobacteraceae bacterium]